MAVCALGDLGSHSKKSTDTGVEVWETYARGWCVHCVITGLTTRRKGSKYLANNGTMMAPIIYDFPLMMIGLVWCSCLLSHFF